MNTPSINVQQTSTPQRILISNDDGILALGVRTLANALAAAGHEVIVVCPDRERSAHSHCLTLHQPLRVNAITEVYDPAVQAWSCSGTPADCVKLALSALLPTPPDFVLSGINQGSNLGTDVLYSGTVAAAMEGTVEAVPSVALSLANFTYRNFTAAAQFAVQLVEQLVQNPVPSTTLLNVNVPPVTVDAIAGVKITRQGRRRYIEQFEKRLDPRGKEYYWLAGEIIDDLEQPTHPHLSADVPVDVQAIKENYITITPLQYNLTDAVVLNSMSRDRFQFKF